LADSGHGASTPKPPPSRLATTPSGLWMHREPAQGAGFSPPHIHLRPSAPQHTGAFTHPVPPLGIRTFNQRFCSSPFLSFLFERRHRYQVLRHFGTSGTIRRGFHNCTTTSIFGQPASYDTMSPIPGGEGEYGSVDGGFPSNQRVRVAVVAPTREFIDRGKREGAGSREHRGKLGSHLHARIPGIRQ